MKNLKPDRIFLLIMVLLFAGPLWSMVSKKTVSFKVPSCTQETEKLKSPEARDNAITLCVQRKIQKNQMSFKECLDTSKTLQYEIFRESLKKNCVSLASSPQACLGAVKILNFAEDQDEMGWQCIEKFRSELSTRHCESFAPYTSNPTMKERVLYACMHELGKAPSLVDCKRLGKEVFAEDPPESVDKYCRELIKLFDNK